jgi:hypothetical protein
LFMASAASAIPDAVTICVNFSTQTIKGVNLTEGAGAGFCNTAAFFGTDQQWAVTGPRGAVGPVGPTGAIGGGGPVGSVGPVGQHGVKGPAGPTGPGGGPGGPGGQGPNGPQGPTGAPGPSVTGATGATGPVGDGGIIGLQGASGPPGPTGASAVLAPVQIQPGITNPAIIAGGGVTLKAGTGDLGNTRTLLGNSQIILSCPPLTNLISGGARLLPGDVNVRGILESSYPTPGGTGGKWVITAEVTQTATIPWAPVGNGSSATLNVDPYVICRG